MARDLPDHRHEVARALADLGPWKLCAELGIERSKTETGKFVCPRHGGGCLQVRVNRGDGLLQVKCFGGCDLAGDCFVLVAEARGLDVRRDFRRVVLECATIAGLWGIVDELQGGAPAAPRDARPSAPPVRPERVEPTYPDADELAAVWNAAGPVDSEDGDDAARETLAARGIDVADVDGGDLARVVLPSATLPAWAVYGRRSWLETGHRLLLPVYDANGVMRSVRAWRIEGADDTPKRLPPKDCKAGGVVLASEIGVAMLAGTFRPAVVVIAEGESDYLTWATKRLDKPAAVLGVFAGAWTPEIAARVPDGASVYVRTDHDTAGDKYAAQVNETLRGRCTVKRSKRPGGGNA